MRASFVDKYPNATKALLKAVQEAQMWCDDMANKDEMAEIVGRRAWFNVPTKDIIDRIKGQFDYGTGRIVKDSPHFMKFWRDHASYPFQSPRSLVPHGRHPLGQIRADPGPMALIAKVNREDLWREAARTGSSGESDSAVHLARQETFFDGKVFDPEKPNSISPASPSSV